MGLGEDFFSHIYWGWKSINYMKTILCEKIMRDQFCAELGEDRSSVHHGKRGLAADLEN